MSKRIGRMYHGARILPRFLGDSRMSAFSKRIWAPLKRRLAWGMRFVAIRQARVVDKVFGVATGNQFFWTSPTMPKGWEDVQRRVFFLHGRRRSDLDQFVELAFSRSSDFVVWTGLARSSLTKERAAAVLCALDPEADAGLARRIRTSHVSAAAVVGAGAICLDEGQMQRLARAVEALLPWQTEGYSAAIDSLGARLDQPPRDACLRSLPESGFRSRKRHCLIVASTLRDTQNLSLFFGGAEEVTLYSLSDLYGKADFAGEPLHCDRDLPINVENARSRVTRFSAEYHALHQETRDQAKRIYDDLAMTGEGVDWLPPDTRIFAEMNLADRLFFPSLTLAALRRLIVDPEFDHIVIALGSRIEDRDFCAMLAGLDELTTDPRVEVVSTAKSVSERLTFAPRLAELRNGSMELPDSGYWGPPPSVYAGQFHDVIRDATAPIVEWSRDGRTRVLFLCAATSAYNDSTAAYLDALLKRFETRMGFAGSNPLPVLNEMGAPGEIAATEIYRLQTSISKSQELRLVGIKAWLDGLLRRVVREMIQDGRRSIPVHLLAVRRAYFVREALISFMVEAHSIDRWFSKMSAADALPEVVVMSPYRDMFVANAVAAARRYSVRSIALEPHGLNANYCRYATIHSDFCGVITEAFRREAASGFGIPLERCRTVGSPRLTAPESYEMQARTEAARQAASRDYGYSFQDGRLVLAFFSQPTNWNQLGKVWRILLEGSAEQDVQIFLKAHPEEAPSRALRYLEIAADLGLGDRVEIWKGNAKEAIECADIVLAAYSATVVEAASLRRPVICLAPEGVDYPLEQHRIVGAPLLRNPAELARMLSEFVKDPSAMRAEAAQFVTQEQQIMEGIDVSLARLVQEIVDMPAGQAIRDQSDLPESCFLAGPHRPFQV
ncbi:hypothetical protein [Albidovulum aquaemixtae]|uniref:hypothetical protein n=1 Tax=Albidovulum aquaemixtae TaxID=1542388 RepID=UPI0011B232C5|nr:hypothetical protein [Defluviimonas aquaemixtae]